MRNPQWLRLAILFPLLAVTLAPLFPIQPPPIHPTPALQAMPPHPERLLEWMREGRPLPPFITDPDFLTRQGIDQPAPRPRHLTGSINALAVLVEFSDKAHTVTASFFDSLIFAAPVAGRGSVRDYYSEVSYLQVDIVTVNLPSSLGWRMAPQTYAWYVNGNYCWGAYPQNCQRLAEDIVDAINSVVDFSNYDNDGDGYMEPIMLTHAGPGAEFTGSPNDIWSHSWTLANPRNYDGVIIDSYVTMPEFWQTVSPVSSDMTIGVYCHEMGHGFWNLPDLYDTDYTSWGVGDWSLMSLGSWNGPNSGGWGSDGSSPAWPDAWSRTVAGFDTARKVIMPTPGYLFPPVETNPNMIARFKTSGILPWESFLAENRQRLPGTYDEWLPGGGLLIWHIDLNIGNNNQECRYIPHCWGNCIANHFRVALEQADGQDHLEFKNNQGDAGDPFPGSTNRTFWRSYLVNPVNPESGSWYDSGCGSYSCIDLTNIACAPLGNCTADINSASCSPVEGDLGDAPASVNSFSLPMTAYGPAGPLLPVQANFPTVYLPVAAPGPRHHFCQIDSWLGASVTGEWNADTGPDQDSTTNISPTIDLADMDSVMYPARDNGVVLPIPIVPCQGSPLAYTLTVGGAGAYMPRYVNAWLDLNRDGDWADSFTCPSGPAPEWAVQDKVFTLGPGTYPQVSTFMPRVAIVEGGPWQSWLRLTFSELPAAAPQDGRGPADGFDYGETEDYSLTIWPDLQITLPPGHPLPGDTTTYTIHYSATGNVIAANSVISDVLPAGIEYLSSNPPGNYDPASRTVSWPVNPTPGAPGAVNLTVSVTGDPCSTIPNTAYLLWAGTIWRRDAVSLTVGCPPDDPLADFAWSEPACAGEPVYFTNLTSGTEPLTFSWDLDGDGLPDSTDQDPIWTYDAGGLYTVTLTATNCCSQSVHTDGVAVIEPLDAVDIVGPVSLLPDEVGTYTAIPTPPEATDPHYTWDNGASGISTTYSWSAPGTYTIVVTGSNDCGLVSGTLEVIVSSVCISLTGVNIAGPTYLDMGQEGTFQATPEPPTATNPAYLWSNGSTAATAVYSWTTPGMYDVMITATNCQDVVVTDTFPVMVGLECISLTGVTIDGPASLGVGQEGTYQATPEPISATLPTYLWSNGSTESSAVYSWDLAGSYTVTVTATNCQDVTFSDSITVLVTSEFRIYLPIVFRRF